VRLSSRGSERRSRRCRSPSRIAGSGWRKCRGWMASCPVVARHTGFRFTVDPSPEQVGVLWRHAGAARFAFDQCLRLVKDALDARAGDKTVAVPWSGFDLINLFNGWKRSADAGRVLVADAQGGVEVVATGLAWRGEVYAQVFEEAAQDLGRGLSAFTATRRSNQRRCGYRADRDYNAAVNLAVWGEQHDTRARDPEVRGPVTNASRETGSGSHPGVGGTCLNDGGTPPPVPSGLRVRGRPRRALSRSHSTRLQDRP
jgi:hypothetical protein